MSEIMANAMRMDNLKILCTIPFKDKTITELDLSGKNLGTEGALVVAEYLDGNGALTLLDLSSNRIGGYFQYYHTSTTGGYGDYTVTPEGPKAIADAIKDMGALSVANIMGNHIGKEMLSKLQEIMRSKPSLISLCGIADDATEADLSGLGMNADDAVILASELPDKRAMTSLNLSNNRLGAEGAMHIAKGIKVSKCAVAVV
jgi:Ran GTPase-activating protein (RanGAP) involved in mRNA processing and transport